MNKKYKGGVRLLEGNNSKCVCIICMDHLSLDNGMILNCGCCWHITCFIQYIVRSFENKDHFFTNNGIKCPGHWNNPRDYSIYLDEVNELINLIRDKNITEMLRESNIVNINYNTFLSNKNRKFKAFTQNNQITRINKEEWENFGNNDSKEKNSQSLIDALTQRCPCGKGGGIHYHGHGCHAIRCSSCKIEFCYRCAGVTNDVLQNKSDDKNYHKCTCNESGSFHTFCINNDIKKNLINDDVLRDKRCNCPICPDCREGRSCAACSETGSDCVVCQGKVKHGSTESKVKHISTFKIFKYKPHKKKVVYYKDPEVEILVKNKGMSKEMPVKVQEKLHSEDNKFFNEYNTDNNQIPNNFFNKYNTDNNQKYLTTTRRRMTTPFTKPKTKNKNKIGNKIGNNDDGENY